MAEINSDYLNRFGLSGYGAAAESTTVVSESSKGKTDLDQSDFMKLMITQLTTQDPTNPVSNEDYIAQMAQFSTLTGIQELSQSFASLSQTLLQGQTLTAATLVGKEVLVPSSTAELSAEGQAIRGAVELTSSANHARVDIYSDSGALVDTLELGALSAGLQEFDWDGLLANGTAAPAGSYEFRITAQSSGAEDESTAALTPLLTGQVRSVSTDATGLMLEVQGIGRVSFDSVKQVR